MNPRIRIVLLMAYDAVMVNMSIMVALLLRFDGAVPQQYWQAYTHWIPLLPVIFMASFYLFKLYNRVWEYASTGELMAIVYSVTAGTTVLYTIMYLANSTLPRGVVVMSWAFTILLVGFSRFAWRMYIQRLKSNGNGHGLGRKTLIIGAGDAGAMVAREMKNHDSSMEPVGFVDDDPGKLGQQLFGLNVMGDRHKIPALVEKYGVEEIIIAMPSVGGSTIREFVDICKQTSAKLKILPGVYDIIDGKVSVSHLREVQLEDLLGREPVEVNLEEMAGYLEGQAVLVTGAGGSIGSELCRQIALFRPEKLIILGHSEYDIHSIWMELQQQHPKLSLSVQITDVRDPGKINRLFSEQRPRVVFHAAAHKHVPLMEMHPDEAIKTNIFGTQNVAKAADRFGVNIFVMISTDKAVNPSSVMGATKRIAEIIVQQLDKTSDTRFTAVRFGNVLGSSGSVVPIFKEQIARGGPVTVTHPEMVRYFMTIPEAVQLVIQAGAMAEGGEVFILDMGEPVRIVDMARDMIRLSGLEPDVDIEIKYTGIRPGEKLFEELLTAEEGSTATRHKRIFMARCSAVTEVVLNEELMRLKQNSKTNIKAKEVFNTLDKIICSTTRDQVVKKRLAVVK